MVLHDADVHFGSAEARSASVIVFGKISAVATRPSDNVRKPTGMFHLHGTTRKKPLLAEPQQGSEDYKAWRCCPQEVSAGTQRGFDWSRDEGGGEAKDGRLCSCFSLIGLGRAQREWRAAAELRQQAALDKEKKKKKQPHSQTHDGGSCTLFTPPLQPGAQANRRVLSDSAGGAETSHSHSAGDLMLELLPLNSITAPELLCKVPPIRKW